MQHDSGRMTTELRRLMRAPGLIHAVNVYDPLTARIAQAAGFKAIALGGFQLGAQLCVTEPTLTMTETLQAGQLIARSVRIPLKVDCGAGFGEPVHVTRTIREAEDAGIACIHIEDQHYPKRAHYHRGIEHVIPAEEMVQKIKAAVAARRDPDFVLVGRTDAMRTDGVEEGIRRGNLYAEAGCDMIEIFPNTYEEAKLAVKEIKAPALYVNSSGNRLGRPVIPWHELEDMGYKMVLDATTVMIAAVRSVRATLDAYVRDGRPPQEVAGDAHTREWIETLIGLPEYYAIEESTVERAPSA
jgi:2-methylisocitrate lyase-like PEP mutase family enzyme